MYPEAVPPSPARLLPLPLLLSALITGCPGEIVGLDDDDSALQGDDDTTGDDDTAMPDDDTDDDDTGDDDTGDDDTSDDEAIWEAFLDAREDYLHALAEPIVQCVTAHDTANPVFHGCVDWHSAVHGTWSLLAISRLTGDPYYAEVADQQLTAEAVDGELAQLEEGGWLAAAEIPYGYSWFLHLAREREDGGDADLVPLADLAAADLGDHLFGLDASGVTGNLLSASYLNLSWEAFNLHRQAMHVEDDELADEIETFVRDEVVPRTDDCPLQAEQTNTSGFFPPCLHAARLVLETLPDDEVQAWLDDHEPGEQQLDPIVQPATTHAAGLNFSRSWGLYALYLATGDTTYRTLYVRHIETHMAMPQYWADSYWSYSHWVAQFGVYGIALSYE